MGGDGAAFNGGPKLTPKPAPQDAETAWSSFLTHALKTRLDPDKFADYAPLLAARHHLNPFAVADLFLRPNPWNRYTLDPRLPHYLQTLLDLRLVDLQAVLAGLFRWSTAHTLVPRKEGSVPAKGFKSEARGEDKHDAKKDNLLRWESSFSSEEVMFYRLTKAIGSGSGIRDAKDALEISLVVAKWMMLFTAASAALPSNHDEDVIMGGINGDASASKKMRDDLENSRAAFVMLLMAVCENPMVLQTLSTPHAKSEWSCFLLRPVSWLTCLLLTYPASRAQGSFSKPGKFHPLHHACPRRSPDSS